jgi:Anti-sigma factor NepR
MVRQPSSRLTLSPGQDQAFQPAGPAQPIAGDAMSSLDGAESGLGADLRAHLGVQLRALYQEIVTEPVPDRFHRLLEDLGSKKDPA